MKKNLIIGLIGVCFLFSGCGKGEQTTAPESQTGQNVMQSEATESVGQTAPDIADYQEPEEGYYSNDEGEILKIEKAEDGTYNIEYSVYHYCMLRARSEAMIHRPENFTLPERMTRGKP